VKSISTLAFIGSLLFSTSVFSQNIQITSHNFPGPLATSCTNTFIDVDVMLLCINAAHQGNTVNVSGSTITIDIDYQLGPLCLPAIATVTQNINLGMLPPGLYSVVINGKENGSIVSTMNTSLIVSSCCPATASYTLPNDTICIGDSVYYNNTSTGATSQQWFENNSSVSTGINYGKRYNSPGTYNIKLVVTDGNCSDSTIKTLFVSPPPALDLGNDTTLCMGQTFNLDAGKNRDSLRWEDNSTAPLRIISTGGLYYVSVYENGCVSSDSINVTLGNSPNVDLGNDTTICLGDSLVLDATVAGATYIWQDTTTNSTYTVKGQGTYVVLVIGSNGCSTLDSITVTIDSCGIGLPDYRPSTPLTVYPNPVNSQLHIQLDNIEPALYDITITDLSGQIRYCKKAELNAKQELTAKLSHLANGVYIIQITGESFTASKSFIKY